MSYGETENIVADTGIREEPQTISAPESTEQISTTTTQVQPSTYNQEAMLAQTLKRLKRQSKEIERLVKGLKQLSTDASASTKNQSKQLRQLQADVTKLNAAVRRIQIKAPSPQKKKTKTSRKAKIRRKK